MTSAVARGCHADTTAAPWWRNTGSRRRRATLELDRADALSTSPDGRGHPLINKGAYNPDYRHWHLRLHTNELWLRWYCLASIFYSGTPEVTDTSSAGTWVGNRLGLNINGNNSMEFRHLVRL